MFIDVKLFSGLPKSLFYQAPIGCKKLPIGSVVHVPIRNRIVPALVLMVHKESPNVSFEIRQVKSIEPFPDDKNYYPFVQKIAQYHALDEIHFVKRIRTFISQ